MRSSLLVALAILVGCAQVQPQSGPAPQPTPAPPPVVVPAPAAPAPNPYRASIASFKGSELDECVDWEIQPKPGQESKVAATRQKFLDGIEKPAKGESPSQIVLEGLCRDQVSGRSELARCEVDREVELGRARITSVYFRYATAGQRDDYMRDCLSLKGEWHANANALEHARLQGQMRRLEKIADGN